MTATHSAILPDRGVVAVTGVDAEKLLQGLITNDMSRLHTASALHAGLLTPQGKILFAFFVVRSPNGFLLETERDKAGDLARRLGFYKLRAAVSIEDVSHLYRVGVLWHGAAPATAGAASAIVYADPRLEALGWRVIAADAVNLFADLTAAPASADDYHAHRIGLGVPDAERDYPLGDTFPHEACFDLFGGADFDKGCFVGQEVVARMQHKTAVRKRVVPVSADADLPADHPEITAGAATFGRLGSVSGSRGLALLRLDRVVEAIDKGERIAASGIALTVAATALDRYRASAASKAGAS